MRILRVHNYHKQRAGEEVSFEKEVEILRRKGNEVKIFTKNSKIVERANIFKKLIFALNSIWSIKTYKEIEKIIDEFKPEIIHFGNIFPMISPSAYYACKKKGIPVIQDLRNYWLICPSDVLYHNGKIYYESLGKFFPIKAVFKKVRRNSFSQSLVAFTMLVVHRIIKTWDKKIDLFITTSNFMKKKYIKAGFSENKIEIKGNFTFPQKKSKLKRLNQALYVGRITEEKGLKTLFNAWKNIEKTKLKIIGSGPNEKEFREFVIKNNIKNIEFLGEKNEEFIKKEMERSLFVCFPSEWYEPFGRVIIEAYSCRTPVIVASIAGPREIVLDKKTGLLFKPKGSNDLERKIKYALKNKSKMVKMGLEGEKEFIKNYSPEANYKKLISIYKKITLK